MTNFNNLVEAAKAIGANYDATFECIEIHPEELHALIAQYIGLDRAQGQAPLAYAEEGRPANVISAWLKGINKKDWIKTYTIPLYPRSAPSQVPPDLANQIAWLKQRLDYPEKSSSHSFSHMDMVNNVWPIICNLVKEIETPTVIQAKEKHHAPD